jgi:magnesium transporter
MAFKRLSDTEKWKLLVKSDVNQAASEFGEKPSEETAQMAQDLGVAYLSNVVEALGTDDAADMLHNLPVDFREQVLSQITPDKANLLREILSYRPGTAGALMAKEYLAVSVEANLREATEYLRSVRPDRKGKVSYIYVVDKNKRLEGVIQIRDLIFYPPETPVRKVLKSPVVQVETGMTQLDVAKLLQKHNYLGLPVVNEKQQLVGVISADSALEVLEKEAADDIAKIVGTGAEEIRSRSVRKIMSLRLPWLFVNIVSGLLCAFISGVFQNDLAAVTALFLFVPVVLGLSESTGVQGATIVVRNIAMGHVAFKDLGSLFMKEALVGILIGLICGTVVGTVGAVWLQNGSLGLALASSMTFAIILSASIGLVLPLVFKRLRLDPAMASGPFVLAICDIQTLLVYFNLSSFILRINPIH